MLKETRYKKNRRSVQEYRRIEPIKAASEGGRGKLKSQRKQLEGEGERGVSGTTLDGNNFRKLWNKVGCGKSVVLECQSELSFSYSNSQNHFVRRGGGGREGKWLEKVFEVSNGR